MLLHIGGETSVKSKEIIAIIDIRTGAQSAATREFLELVKDQNMLVDISTGDAKSSVVTQYRTYLSPISAVTLGRRANAVPEKVS